MALTPIRRVVTGNDEKGKSRVVWDGPAPGTHEAQLPGVSGAPDERPRAHRSTEKSR
jgi:hypothetical protein